jgi:hypothetical protein
MKKIILQVSSIKPFEEGFTCTLTRNGRKVAYIGPGIFDWCSNAFMTEVLEFFASEHGLKLEAPEPKELTESWQPDTTDLERHEQRFNSVQEKLLDWINLHFTATKYLQHSKKTLVTLNPRTGQVLDWQVPARNLHQCGSAVAQIQTMALKLISSMSVSEIVSAIYSAKQHERMP